MPRAGYLFVTWLLAVASTAVCHDVHTRMSPNELFRVFAIDTADQVPEYDVFTLFEMRRKRSIFYDHDHRLVKFNAFNRTFNLQLRLNNRLQHDTRVFLASTTEHDARVRIDHVLNRGQTHFDLFQDVSNQAALSVRHSRDGFAELSGTVGPFAVVRVPQRVCKQLSVRAGQIDGIVSETNSYNCSGQLPHIIFKMDKKLKPSSSSDIVDGGELRYSPYNFNSLDDPSDSRRHHRRRKRNTPNLYPEVLVFVDYDTYIIHDSDIDETKNYILSFINAMDLRYRLTRYVTIRIQVADIVIATDRKSTPYLENNLIGEGNLVAATSALGDFAKFLYEKHDLPSYDVAMTITKLDMCSRTAGSCDETTAGYAYVGGGCAVSDFNRQINSVALVEDSGGFSGVIVACHELGHVLGSVHDGSSSPRYLGGTGALSCPWSDGFIMSDQRFDQNGVRWSTCSLNQFAHFARDWRSRCMQNNPVSRKNVDRFSLPGKMFSLDEQCYRDHGTSACFRDARVCTSLYCWTSDFSQCIAYRPAAEGSPCARGKHCVHGQCKSDRYYY